MGRQKILASVIHGQRHEDMRVVYCLSVFDDILSMVPIT
jgi:hypothetical protein